MKDKALEALEKLPCAGCGQEKVKEVMVWVNTYQSVIIAGLEAISGEKYLDIVKRLNEEWIRSRSKND